MLEDPIIEELHKIRAEIAAESNYDMHAIVVALRRRQQAENRTVVTLPPKRVANSQRAKSSGKTAKIKRG